MELGSLTPELQMIARANEVRHALVTRFGPVWSAKTTEEITSEVELAALIGPERMDQLIQFLRAADRVKFASVAPEAAQGSAWDAWVATFVAELAPAAGAMSRIKGR